MKKMVLPLIVFVIFLFSCSSSLTDDARKMAEFACRQQELNLRAMRGEENAKKELEALWKEREEFHTKMNEKYKAADREKLEAEASKLSRKCWH